METTKSSRCTKKIPLIFNKVYCNVEAQFINETAHVLLRYGSFILFLQNNRKIKILIYTNTIETKVKNREEWHDKTVI